MLKKVYALGWLILASFSCFSQNPLITSDSNQQQLWVDSVYNKLNLDERIGQLFMTAAYSNQGKKHQEYIHRLVKNHHIGGLIFMQGGPMRQAKLTNHYQAIAEVPLLIGMDLEWGLGMRLDSTIHYPKQLTLGAIQDNQLVYKMGQQIGEQMKTMGVHVNFAPVADININPNNPVIGYRSFGEDKYNVAAKATAYMKGLQDAGVVACAKHFPGHGDTETDSHFELPIVAHSKARLDSIEYYPFQQLIDNRVQGVMSAHLHVPAIDATNNLSSSLSKPAITDELRGRLGFEGLIFTDALNMDAVTLHFEPGMVELQAFIAGNDILLFSQDVPKAIKTIKKAIRKRQIKRQELEQRVKRILLAKFASGLNNPQLTNTDNLILRLNNPQFQSLNRSLYEKAITVVENKDNLLPFQLLDTLQLASLSINGDHKLLTNSLNKYLYCPDFDYTSQDSSSLLEKLSLFDAVVVSVSPSNTPASNHGISSEAIRLVKDLARRTHVIVVVLGSPYSIKHFDGIDNIICANQDNFHTQEIVPQVLFGGLPATGRMSVSSGPFQTNLGITTSSLDRLSYASPEAVGMSSRVLNKIDDIAHEAISNHATPGLQVLVARNGKVVFEKAYGYFTYDSLQPTTLETIYDIASITKVAATLQAIHFLVDKGMIDMDKKLSYYLPGLKNTNKEHMIIRDILSHQAGLWPYLPFWKNTLEDGMPLPGFYTYYPQDKFPFYVAQGLYSSAEIMEKLWQWVVDSQIREKTERTPYDYKYSDMGYYLLQRLVEALLNQPMEDFLTQNLYDPLGLTTLSYLPLCKFPIDRIAPTEDDQEFRKSLIKGSVHDQGAALIGGVAGHAGLFSNVNDLAKLLQMHLQNGEYGGETYYKATTLEEFRIPQYKSNRRGAGWDKPLAGAWYGPTSEYASPKTFGHTGFTGTAAWADPEFDLLYIFLSNRIYPDSNNTKLIKTNIRTRIQDLIYQSIWENCDSSAQ